MSRHNGLFGLNPGGWLRKVLALGFLLSVGWPYAPYALVKVIEFFAGYLTGKAQETGIQPPPFGEFLVGSWAWVNYAVCFVFSAAIVNTLSERRSKREDVPFLERRRCYECGKPFTTATNHRVCEECRAMDDPQFKFAIGLCVEFGCLRRTTDPDGVCDLHAGSAVVGNADAGIDSTGDLETFKALRSEWLEKEMDPASCWLMPQILDVRVAETAAFHDAFEEAAGLLDSEDRVTNGHGFRSAVALMAERWALALAHAETVGTTRFTAEQTRLTTRMSSLHRLASRADAPPAEVQNARQALGRAQAEWATSLGLPAKSGHAALALVSAERPAIR